jgi:serine/threonine protein kinase
MQIIQHICECLIDLHQAGYVHRDLKPGNITQLPSQNRRTLIDFGCTARIGEDSRIGFSLKYAAPEVVRAHIQEEQSQALRAAPALDVWSVGAIAVELFSGRQPLQTFQGQEQVSRLAAASSCACHCLKEISRISHLTSIDSRRNSCSGNLVLYCSHSQVKRHLLDTQALEVEMNGTDSCAMFHVDSGRPGDWRSLLSMRNGP